jgi:hypothetical protein
LKGVEDHRGGEEKEDHAQDREHLRRHQEITPSGMNVSRV